MAHVRVKGHALASAVGISTANDYYVNDRDWQAVCRCGWRSENNYVSRAACIEEHRRHKRDVQALEAHQ